MNSVEYLPNGIKIKTKLVNVEFVFSTNGRMVLRTTRIAVTTTITDEGVKVEREIIVDDVVF